jgi:glutamyl-tRNA synthetase
MKKAVTRYAPSPTGNPHIGNIRTALFSYLWAKHEGGKFLLRIEDTDRERLVPESLKNIEESLKWLGLSYSDELVFQSDRKDIHLKYAEKLLKEGKAYKCFCTKERLDKLRAEQTKKKLPPGYDRHCRELGREAVAEREALGEKYVIRFAMPEKGKAVWQDAIRGEMEIDFVVSDDPVIIKTDGWPTYHLAAVVDDHEMKVTDIVRGEEWIPSTPKHIALYKAFGWDMPRFAHMPHINGPDGSKLSKRHGDTAILDFRDKGYLPEAMMNFLALLGWNDGTEKEIFTESELIKSFDLERIGKSPAVFDIKKLDWINGQYIRAMDDGKLIQILKDAYPKERITNIPNFGKIVAVEKTRLAKLTDLFDNTEYFFSLPKYISGLLVFKKGTKEDAKKGLAAAREALLSADWTGAGTKEFEDILKRVVEKNTLSNGDVFWPIRVALSGLDKSPSPAELLWIFGQEESLKRIDKALEVI